MRRIVLYVNCVFVSVSAIGALLVGDEALSWYFFLGAFQLLTGFIILAMNSMTFQNKLPEILLYWGLVALYFFIIVPVVPNETIRLLVVPMLIALYHCYVTYKFTLL